jgi:hypothetical protein
MTSRILHDVILNFSKPVKNNSLNVGPNTMMDMPFETIVFLGMYHLIIEGIFYMPNLLFFCFFYFLVSLKILCMYKGWAIKTCPCTATFNDLLRSKDAMKDAMKDT